MAGTELIKLLAEMEYRIPFVAMTGQGDEKIAVEMMKLGARDYLVIWVAARRCALLSACLASPGPGAIRVVALCWRREAITTLISMPFDDRISCHATPAS